MAIAFTNLGVSVGLGAQGNDNPDINDGLNLTSYANASWTPPTTGIIVVFVQSRRNGGPDSCTMSGNSLTWVRIVDAVDLNSGGGNQLSLFTADASGSGTGATTVDFGANTQVHCQVSFFQVTGVDITGGVANAFVQTPTNTGTGTSGTVTLSAAGDAANRPISCFWHLANEVSEERANWTEIDDMRGAGQNRGVITQQRDDAFETTGSASWATSAAWGVIAAELKASADGVTVPVFERQYRSMRA